MKEWDIFFRRVILTIGKNEDQKRRQESVDFINIRFFSQLTGIRKRNLNPNMVREPATGIHDPLPMGNLWVI